MDMNKSTLSKLQRKNNLIAVTLYGEMYKNVMYFELWDYLMPAVELIERGNIGFKLCRKRVEIFWDDTKITLLEYKGASRKESLHEALFQYCRWIQDTALPGQLLNLGHEYYPCDTK